MINLYIDLLQPGEFRYQGPVNKGFVIKVGAFFLVAVLLVGGALFYVQYQQKQQKRQQLETTWRELKPQYEKLQQKQQAIQDNQEILDQLEGWRDSRISMAGFLEVFRKNVPEQISLSRLDLGADFGTFTPEGQEQAVASRKYVLNVRGRALGANPQETVPDFVSRLRRHPVLGAWFADVSQRQLRRSPEGGFSFEIRAQSKPREL